MAARLEENNASLGGLDGNQASGALGASSLAPDGLPLDTLKMPAYVWPLIGGAAIILVFCFLIGLLILQPGTKEMAQKKKVEQ